MAHYDSDIERNAQLSIPQVPQAPIEIDKPISIIIKANRLTGGGVEQVSIADATVFSFYVNISGGQQEWKLDIPKTTDPSHNYSAVFTTAARLSMEHGVKILPFSFDEKRK